MPIVPVTNTIVEMIAIIEISEFDLANRKPESVANVVRGSPAGSRTEGHHDSHELNASRAPGELDEFIPTVCVIYISLREWMPLVVIVRVQMHRIVSRPVFDPELPGVRGAPVNSNCVDRFRCAEIDHHPLRMRIFGFTGEMRIEVGIAFPKRILIAVGDSRITVIVCLIDGVSAPRQTLAVGHVDLFTE